MTDPKSYISSGILELYVSGGLSKQEIAEVQEMAARYPEVQAEIEAIEESVAALAMGFSRKPKRDLLAGVMDMIEEEQEKDHVPVIPLNPDKKQSEGGNNYKWLAIAAAIAFLISLVFNVFQFQQNQENQIRIATLIESNDIFAEQNQRTSQKLEILSSPLFRRVDLLGQPQSPSSLATVFFSTSKQEIYLNTGNLTLADTEKQFQLWAIIDGQPVDAGVFDPQEGVLAQAKSLGGNIQAFAITLEPRGGSKTPTLEQMYVMGKVG